MIKVNLNKKPKKVKIRIERKSFMLYFIAPVLLGLLVIFLMQYSIESKINGTDKNITAYNEKISVLLPKVQAVNAIKKKNNEILGKINTIKTLKKEQMGPIGYIYYITTAIPRFAWISSFKSVNGNITVNGIALDGQVVSLFMDNLNKTGFFNNVALLQTTEVKKQGLKLQNFNLTFHYKSRLVSKVKK